LPLQFVEHVIVHSAAQRFEATYRTFVHLMTTKNGPVPSAIAGAASILVDLHEKPAVHSTQVSDELPATTPESEREIHQPPPLS